MPTQRRPPNRRHFYKYFRNVKLVFKSFFAQFKYIFNLLRATDFITPFQSGFIPKDSTVNQLVSVYHSFCKALDEGKGVRAVFCDVSKAFDREWHAGLIHKLRLSGISGNLLSWLQDYLNDRRQCV